MMDRSENLESCILLGVLALSFAGGPAFAEGETASDRAELIVVLKHDLAVKQTHRDWENGRVESGPQSVAVANADRRAALANIDAWSLEAFTVPMDQEATLYRQMCVRELSAHRPFWFTVTANTPWQM